MNKRGFEFVITGMRKNRIGIYNLPSRSTANSAAYDFFSPIDVIIKPGESVLIWTDIKCFMKKNEYLAIYVRSSMGTKRINLINQVGIIDSDYYGNPDTDGNIGINLYNFGEHPYEIKAGDKIAQGIFSKYLTCGDKPITKRKGGFGSTGK